MMNSLRRASGPVPERLQKTLIPLHKLTVKPEPLLLVHNRQTRNSEEFLCPKIFKLYMSRIELKQQSGVYSP